MIAVSSGGMLNCPFPEWEVATSMKGAYDGNLAYAYAKRGQVLLMEQWAASHPDTKYLSCHPGWTETPAVQAAYGDDAKYLAPMRTPWEGAEAICWLAVAPDELLQSGEFYLDRKPRAKHMAGPFFTEGSFTKNSPEQVEHMIEHLEQWARGDRPSMPSAHEALSADTEIPLRELPRPIRIEDFMGKWYVQCGKFTTFEHGSRNGTEHYRWTGDKVEVAYRYTDAKGKPGELLQRAKIVNTETNTHWAISPKLGPFYVPLGISYLVLHCAEDYSYTVIGVPNRSYLWVMSRTGQMDPRDLEVCLACAKQCGYDLDGLEYIEHDHVGAPGEGE